MSTTHIITFGYLHGGPPPQAHITLDLRSHFRDPYVNPQLRDMTAHDAAVRDAVMNTAGVHSLVNAAAAAVTAYLSGPSDDPVTVAVGCAGGRHRAATVGLELADELRVMHGVDAQVTHRDLSKPVIHR